MEEEEVAEGQDQEEECEGEGTAWADVGEGGDHAWEGHGRLQRQGSSFQADHARSLDPVMISNLDAEEMELNNCSDNQSWIKTASRQVMILQFLYYIILLVP